MPEQPNPPVPPQTEARYQPPVRMSLILRVRRWLRWLGIENEHGLFSWRAMLIGIALYVFLTWTTPYTTGLLVLAFINHFVEGHRSQERTRLAMESARSLQQTKMGCETQVAVKMADAQKVEGLDALLKRLDALEGKFKMVATPERFEKMEQFYKARLGVNLGGK